MPKTCVREVDGSVMVQVPVHIVDQLNLKAGTEVEIELREDRLIIVPRRLPRYSLEELLADCKSDIQLSAEEREWLDARAVGREIEI